MVLLEESIPFSIDYAGQTVDITSTSMEVENFLQELNVYGQKKQEVLTSWEDGQAVVELEDAKNGQVFALRLTEELAIGEEKLAADTTLAFSVVSVIEKGVISFEGLKLPNQTIPMYIEELYAGPDHVLKDTKHHFVYDPENNDISFDINVEANKEDTSDTEEDAEEDPEAENVGDRGAIKATADTEDSKESDFEEELQEDVLGAIINRLARASVQIIKTDGMDSKPLEGVEFELYQIPAAVNEDELEEDSESSIDDKGEDVETPVDDADAESETEAVEEENDEGKTLIGVYVTDENGEINVENLPTGHYLFVETKALDWYYSNEEEYIFEVSPENDGEVVFFEVENHRLDLEVETRFVETATGEQVIDPTKDNHLTDYTWIRGGKEGHVYHMYTEYINKHTKAYSNEHL